MSAFIRWVRSNTSRPAMISSVRGRGKGNVIGVQHPPRSLGQHHDAVRKEQRLLDGMGDEDDGRVRLHPDLLHQPVHLLAREGVERAEGLVHQEDRRAQRQRPHDGRALLHPSRQLAREAGLEPLEFHPVQEVVDPVAIRGAALDLEGEEDVAHQRPPGQQVRLLEDQPDVGMRPGDWLAVEDDLTIRQPVKPGHGPQQRRLPAARRPDDGDDPVRAHLEGAVPQRHEVAVALPGAADL
jgi:hypothetical protein